MKLMFYLRQVFCKHDFVVEELKTEQTHIKKLGWVDTRVFMKCDKCGFSHWYWKPYKK
jgi:hypothetical protein